GARPSISVDVHWMRGSRKFCLVRSLLGWNQVDQRTHLPALRPAAGEPAEPRLWALSGSAPGILSASGDRLLPAERRSGSARGRVACAEIRGSACAGPAALHAARGSLSAGPIRLRSHRTRASSSRTAPEPRLQSSPPPHPRAGTAVWVAGR